MVGFVVCIALLHHKSAVIQALICQGVTVDVSSMFCFYRCAVFQALIYQDMTFDLSSAFYFYQIEAVEYLGFVWEPPASTNLLGQDEDEKMAPNHSRPADHQPLQIEDGPAMDSSFEYWLALEPLPQKMARSYLQSCIFRETSDDSFAAVAEEVRLYRSTLAGTAHKDELR